MIIKEEQNTNDNFITEENYYSYDAINFSSLKVFIDNPLLYKDMFINKTKEMESTPAMEYGSKFHILVLEPSKLNELYIREDDYNKESHDFFINNADQETLKKFNKSGATSGNSTYAQWIKNNFQSDKILLKDKEFDDLQEMRLNTNNCIRRLLKQHHGVDEIPKMRFEKPLTWWDKETNLRCKTKIDAMFKYSVNKEKRIGIIELKSTAEIKELKLSKLEDGLGYEHKEFESKHYYLQVGFQIMALLENGFIDAPYQLKYYWVECCKKNKYSDYSLLSEEFMSICLKSYRIYMDKLKYARDHNKWLLANRTSHKLIYPSDYLVKKMEV